MKKLLAVLLTALLVFTSAGFTLAAEDSNSFSFVCYNIAGLPTSLNAPFNQIDIAKYLSEKDYDIVAVQEDFNLHYAFDYFLDKDVYPYQTAFTGSVPGGDGLNVYSDKAIYNETRTTWEVAHGVLQDGADEMTPKGILFTVVDMGDGVYLDLYNIHADANGEDGDREARIAQFKQLAKIIKERDSKNPIIVTGDFNYSIHYNGYDAKFLYEEIYVGCGLKDAWFEVHNDGEYTRESLQDYVDQYGSTDYSNSYGRWNSIEKILYKDGENVKLTATSFKYEYVGGGEKDGYSDHPAAIADFTYEVDGEAINNGDKLEVVKRTQKQNIFAFVATLVGDVFRLLFNIDQVKDLLA